MSPPIVVPAMASSLSFAIQSLSRIIDNAITDGNETVAFSESGRCGDRPGSWLGRLDNPRHRIILASHPASRVITAATQKDRIDADIQLAGVKPMRCPKEVHAEAHHDTYPGWMSW